MDTISSRETNSNFMPMIAIGAAAIAFILAIIALVKMAGVNKDINDVKQGISARVDSLESQVAQVGQVTNNNDASIKNISQGTQTGFNSISTELIQIKARLDKLEAQRVAPATARNEARGPIVAGPGEYKVKSGDTGAKIAAANGVKLSDLMAVNPDVNWNRMHVGQTIKLPAKAGAQQARPQTAQ